MLNWFKKRKPPPEVPSEVYPMGTGPLNRHGMPQVPIAQRVTRKWPVLHSDEPPPIPREEWRLVLDGACGNPLELDFGQLLGLPQLEFEADFHCVTTWSKLDMRWKGVALHEVLRPAQPHGNYVMCHSYGGYETNLQWQQPDLYLVYEAQGEPLAHEHGGPVRVIAPRLYAWKGAKWIRRLEVMTEDRPGYWERNGYSMTADPWADDRFAAGGSSQSTLLR